MSYTPTEWKTGDVITAEKLNNMESGIGDNASLNIIFYKENDKWKSNKTIEEINEFIEQHGPFNVFAITADPNMPWKYGSRYYLGSYGNDPDNDVNYYQFNYCSVSSTFGAKEIFFKLTTQGLDRSESTYKV